MNNSRDKIEKMKVCVVGLGKAGLPLASVIADSGIEVIGFDISKQRVQEINNKINPIPEEPELAELIEKHAGKNLIATNDVEDLRDCDAFIVIVPLFIDKNHQPDFSILQSAFSTVSSVMKENALIVLETTVPPGTTDTKVTEWLDFSEKKYYLAYSPERIMTGYSVSRYREFPKVVGGVTKEAGKKAYELYSQFCKEVQKVTDSKTAELIKVAEGVYRDSNIAIANELFKVSEELGVNFNEVREFANHKFCHIHKPGNVGGHCICVYPWFLINDYEVPVIKTARLQNDKMIEYYANQLKVQSGKILVIGLTYREGVKELAYTRSIPMLKLLEERGYEVYAYDEMFTGDEIAELGFKPSRNFEEMHGIILMNNVLSLKEDLMPFKEKVVDVKGALE